MTEKRYDLVVLGGGSGGYAAALRAAQTGASVALVEQDKLGGTCLHRGCVPTKALLHAGEVAETARTADRIGVLAGWDGGVDAERLRTWREGIVEAKHKGLRSLISARGITVVAGAGRLTPEGAVQVGDDILRGTDVVLATGSTSRTIPTVPIGGRIVTSDGALALDTPPTRALILGGGVIGVEFASAWRSLGAEVTVIEALDTLVPAEDESVRTALLRALRKRDITCLLSSRVVGAEQSDHDVTVTLEDGSTHTADVLLVAVGRAPVTADMGFEEAGVVLERGFVRTDDRLRTDADHIWAVGDIVDGPQLAHRGFQQGIFVAETIAGLAPVPVPDTQIPRVIYSQPEVTAVGLTERQARERFGDDGIATTQFNLAGNARSAILGTAGSVTAIRAVGGPVLGVHLVGDRVSELITEAQLVVGWDAHPEDITGFIHAHPTQSEALGEAFLSLAGTPLHAL